MPSPVLPRHRREAERYAKPREGWPDSAEDAYAQGLADADGRTAATLERAALRPGVSKAEGERLWVLAADIRVGAHWEESGDGES